MTEARTLYTVVMRQSCRCQPVRIVVREITAVQCVWCGSIWAYDDKLKGSIDA